MPFTIGLTGNIACGKSTVAGILAEQGALVIDADKVAHQVMAPPGPVFDALVAEYGSAILSAEEAIDRKKLGAIVFSNPAALRRLDQIVHPATSAEIRKLVGNAVEPVVVVEAIKLIESGTYRICDSIWVVTCTREQQIERLIAKRGLTSADAERRVDAQTGLAEKLAHANVVIDASGTLDDTRLQVDAAWSTVVKPNITNV